jgi:NAD+ synthase (glutamine-hydrolysing)
MKTVRLALCQINPTVGDFKGNTDKIINCIKKASRQSPDIVAFPELSVTGYPPEDLLLKPQFIKDNIHALNIIKEAVGDFIVIVGFVDRKDDIYNAAAVIRNKKIVDVYHKIHLPNYGVFDEYRYFQTGFRFPIYRFGEARFGITICEDIWYPEGPATIQSLSGAEFIININASPYNVGKSGVRENMVASRAADNSVAIAYLNAVGGQDELVFDGGSFVVDQNGEVIAKGKMFQEDMLIADLDLDAVFMKRLHDPRRRSQTASMPKDRIENITIESDKKASKGIRKKLIRQVCPAPISAYQTVSRGTSIAIEEEVYSALVLGTRDYVSKNGFKKVCIGLSGGIDSSFVAAIAVDSIGKDNVTGVFMPSKYTSKESKEDAYSLAENLGIEIKNISINDVFESYISMLEPVFKKMTPDITEENLQARIRGNILMALSNKFGWLVLTTGNKSEMSVGYATLYGDMAGGFAVIKDVPKTLVYKICKWKNKSCGLDVIPQRVFTKEPTAELRHGQKDSDSLPPYDALDPIIKAYVEEDKSFEEIVGLGCGIADSRKVIRLVDRSEYKRRQSPPGIKITARAFGRDRRFPITNRYKSY